MAWNWQQPDWPAFTWDPALMGKAEEQFLLGVGLVAGSMKHLPGTDQEQVTIEAISTEAVTTSEIEGEVLDRASVQSSLRRQLGLNFDQRKVRPQEHGIAKMMVSLYRSFAEPLSDEMLFAWHAMLMNGRGDLKIVGTYRTGSEPMQVVSGAVYEPKIHFEAPPSSIVRKEMKRFVRWFNETAPSGKSPLPALTRAGVAHLYFVSIHPFEDGNGRIGRAIAEKALAQCVGQPTLTALAATILQKRKAYYEELERANKRNRISTWLRWFGGIGLEAQGRTTALVEFLIQKARLLDRLKGSLNQRQEKALMRMLREGPDGFTGGLSAGNYQTITGASPATATRDLVGLVAMGALVKSGERRHARYWVAIPVAPQESVVIADEGSIRRMRKITS